MVIFSTHRPIYFFYLTYQRVLRERKIFMMDSYSALWEICQWKNFENRLTFDWVITKRLCGCFSYSVYIKANWHTLSPRKGGPTTSSKFKCCTVHLSAVHMTWLLNMNSSLFHLIIFQNFFRRAQAQEPPKYATTLSTSLQKGWRFYKILDTA